MFHWSQSPRLFQEKQTFPASLEGSECYSAEALKGYAGRLYTGVNTDGFLEGYSGQKIKGKQKINNLERVWINMTAEMTCPT